MELWQKIIDKFESVFCEKLIGINNRISKSKIKFIKRSLTGINLIFLISGISVFLSNIKFGYVQIGFIDDSIKVINGFIANNRNILLAPYTFGIGIISVFVSITSAYYLSDSYKLNKINLSAFSLMISLMLSNTIQYYNDSLIFNYKELGSKNVFAVIFVSAIVVLINYFFNENKIMFKPSKKIGDNIWASINEIIPYLVTIIIFVLINRLSILLSDESLFENIAILSELVLDFTDNLFIFLIFVVIAQMCWVYGIHGSSFTGEFTTFFCLMHLACNIEAYAYGNQLPYSLAGSSLYGFYGDWIMSRSFCYLTKYFMKSNHLKECASNGFFINFFNVEEQIIFGTPIVKNKYLLFPWLFLPCFNLSAYYVCTKIGLLSKLIINLPFCFPVSLGSFISIADFRGFLFFVIMVIFDMIIAYPFFKKYDDILISHQ